MEDRHHYPKYHCELNYIEMVWGFMKSYLRRHCSYNFNDLKEKIPRLIENDIPLAFAYDSCQAIELDLKDP